jgi:hypothetical protein
MPVLPQYVFMARTETALSYCRLSLSVAVTPRLWAVGWVSWVNTINVATLSDNGYLSDKIKICYYNCDQS